MGAKEKNNDVLIDLVYLVKRLKKEFYQLRNQE